MAMEIPVIESGIARFQSPNLVVHLRTLWTWLALILAAVATFSSLFRRSKRAILGFRRGRSVITHPTPSDCYASDDDNVSCSSVDDNEDDGAEDEVDSEPEKDFGDLDGEIQRQNGESGQHFEWPGLARDGSVVKLWEGLGLGFDRSKGSMSLLDLDREEVLRSLLWGSGEIPAVHVASPGTFVSAGNRGLGVWDSRAADIAAAGATWQGEGTGRCVGIVGGNDNEVYVGDDVGKLRVVDLRNLRSPSAEAWWWGDGSVTAGDGGDGLVSWCKNAARFLNRK